MRGRTFKRHTQHNQHVQHIVHADGTTTQQTTPIQSDGLAQKIKRRASTKVVVIAFVIIFAGIAGLLIVKNSTDSSVKQSIDTGAANNLIQQAIPNLDSAKQVDLQAIAKQIQDLKNYESSPDLLYIVTLSDVYNNDFSNAQRHLETLKKVYKPDIGYSSAELRSVALDIDVLENLYTFNKQQVDEIKANSFLAPEGVN